MIFCPLCHQTIAETDYSEMSNLVVCRHCERTFYLDAVQRANWFGKEQWNLHGNTFSARCFSEHLSEHFSEKSSGNEFFLPSGMTLDISSATRTLRFVYRRVRWVQLLICLMLLPTFLMFLLEWLGSLRDGYDVFMLTFWNLVLQPWYWAWLLCTVWKRYEIQVKPHAGIAKPFERPNDGKSFGGTLKFFRGVGVFGLSTYIRYDTRTTVTLSPHSSCRNRLALRKFPYARFLDISSLDNRIEVTTNIRGIGSQRHLFSVPNAECTRFFAYFLYHTIGGEPPFAEFVVRCPYCHEAVSNDQLHPLDDVAFCSACRQKFSIAAVVSQDALMPRDMSMFVGCKEPLLTRIDVSHPPRSIRLTERTSDGLRFISQYNRDRYLLGGICSTLLAIFFTPLLLFCSLGVMVGEQPQPIIPILFIPTCLLLWWLPLEIWFGRDEIVWRRFPSNAATTSSQSRWLCILQKVRRVMDRLRFRWSRYVWFRSLCSIAKATFTRFQRFPFWCKIGVKRAANPNATSDTSRVLHGKEQGVENLDTENAERTLSQDLTYEVLGEIVRYHAIGALRFWRTRIPVTRYTQILEQWNEFSHSKPLVTLQIQTGAASMSLLGGYCSDPDERAWIATYLWRDIHPMK